MKKIIIHHSRCSKTLCKKPCRTVDLEMWAQIALNGPILLSDSAGNEHSVRINNFTGSCPHGCVEVVENEC